MGFRVGGPGPGEIWGGIPKTAIILPRRQTFRLQQADMPPSGAKGARQARRFRDILENQDLLAWPVVGNEQATSGSQA